VRAEADIVGSAASNSSTPQRKLRRLDVVFKVVGPLTVSIAVAVEQLEVPERIL
jgi:hypothetical protein